MVSMKQVIGFWGINYQEVANFLGYKSSSTIEKRVKNNDWKIHEVAAILQEVEKTTGVKIDMALLKMD